jgi:hypothetical protein
MGVLVQVWRPLGSATGRGALADAGFVDLEIRETHRVHEHAGSAIIRARKPH